MGTQLRFVTKEEAHRLIDETPGTGVMILTYDNSVGISDSGKFIRKKRGKKMVDKASVLVLAESNPVITLNLHGKYFSDFSRYDKENIDKSILLAKLE